MREKFNLKEKGITLIALVITVIILLIIAAVSIGLVTNGGLFDITDEATFKTRIQQYKEATDIYMLKLVSDSIVENAEVLAKTKINAGNALKDMIGKENSPLGNDFTIADISNELKEIIPQVNSKEEQYIVIYKGELCYVSQKSIKYNSEYKRWCKQLGIKVLESSDTPIIEDIAPDEAFEIIDGSYLNVNGLYMCTPDISGLNKNKTRYLKLNEKGYLVTTNEFSNLAPDETWYDYSNQIWANIYVESEGNCAFYTWIPRYAYKIADTTKVQERTEVIFIDLDNSYKYVDDNGQVQIKTWDELKNEYIVPNAFYFGDNDNNTDRPIPGYWMSKYPVGALSSGYIIQYDFAAVGDSVLIRNMEINVNNLKNELGEDIVLSYYQYAMNGRVISTIKASENPTEYTIPGLEAGLNTFTVTLLDQNEEIIGSMTKEYEISAPNPPDLTGFDAKNTYYVVYDENFEEHSTIPITEPAPKGWYAYEHRIWANIVVRVNGAESYFTWIPRYAYSTTGESASVRFLKDTSKEVPEGYILPDAFAWSDDDANTESATQLKGYWMSKYALGATSPSPLNTEFVNTSNTITIKGLTGTDIAENQVYNYWIDGVKKGTKTNPTEEFTYTGLTPNTNYTVLVEIRKNDANSTYVGTITKEVKTNNPNEPNLMGFDNDPNDGDNTMTYYVTYYKDSNGEIEEDTNYIPITQPAPNNWYDYSNSIWANVVVIKTDGSGNEIAKTYFTWIPRYAYRAVTDKQRTDIVFLPGTSREVPRGYTLPDAFAFGDNETDFTQNTQLTGYWMSKYAVGSY